MDINQIRQQYPQYDDLSDDKLLQGLHAKHYSDMPFDQFASKVGVQPAQAQPQQPQAAGFNPVGYAGGIADQLAQGVTLGWSDELEAAARTGASNIFGDGSVEYGDKLNEVRGRINQFRKDNPKVGSAAEMTGGFGTGVVGAAKVPLMQAHNIGKAALMGGLEGMTYGAGAAEGDKVEGGLVGGTLGAVAAPLMYGGGELAGRIGRNLPGLDRFKWKPEGPKARANIDNANRLGLELTPAQVTDNRGLEILESNLKRNMGGAGPFDARYDKNQEVVQRLANKELGLPGTEIDLGKAKQLNSAQFVEAGKQGDKLTFDHDFLNDVVQVKQGYESAWGRIGKDRIFKDITTELQKGSITPSRYQYLMSQLSDDLHKASVAGDGGRVKLYGGLQRALDNLADRNIPEANRAFHDARQAFRVRKTLERPGVTNPGTGEVSIAKLANAQKRDKDFIYGWDQTELAQAGRIQQAFKTDIGSSGTPEGSASGLMLSPLYYGLSRGYNAIPNSMFGNSGLGQYTKRASLIPYAPALESYRQTMEQ